MLKYLSIENIAAVALTIFWAIFYVWTAASLVAALYATVEHFLGGVLTPLLRLLPQGGAILALQKSLVGEQVADVVITYPRGSVSKGLSIGLAGFGGVIAGWIILPLISGRAPFPPPNQLFAGAFSADTVGLLVAIVSAIVFNIGVWIALTREEWTTT